MQGAGFGELSMLSHMLRCSGQTEWQELNIQYRFASQTEEFKGF